VRIAYFDPFSGASGDMVLGALIDCGVGLAALQAILAGLGIDGYALRAERVVRSGISGTQVTVDAEDAVPARDWSAIRDLLERADLPEPVQAGALATFRRLAEAESFVHGVELERVHFHEIGGIDALVDIVGAAAGLFLLGVERVFTGPPALGRGFTQSMHGVIPVPAPATARLLAMANAPARDAEIDAELLTPTGAAILTTFAEFARPEFRSRTVGYGFGMRELPWPNALRLWIGDVEPAGAQPSVADGPATTELLLETNIDDMNPEFYELLVERMFEAGALDVFMNPIIMKRGRPATTVSAIVGREHRAAVEHVLVENSSTFGIRATSIERTKVGRTWRTVATRWGDVRLKLKLWRGRVLEASPEYADCVAIARESGAPLRLVYGEAQRLGDVFVGQRLTVDDADEG
jgi:uncharacterized protein (TIGR00299 family) protein